MKISYFWSTEAVKKATAVPQWIFTTAHWGMLADLIFTQSILIEFASIYLSLLKTTFECNKYDLTDKCQRCFLIAFCKQYIFPAVNSGWPQFTLSLCRDCSAWGGGIRPQSFQWSQIGHESLRGFLVNVSTSFSRPVSYCSLLDMKSALVISQVSFKD